MSPVRILIELKRQSSYSISLSEYGEAFGVGVNGLGALRSFVKSHRLSYRWMGEILVISRGDV